jgi:hypothetical protein
MIPHRTLTVHVRPLDREPPQQDRCAAFFIREVPPRLSKRERGSGSLLTSLTVPQSGNKKQMALKRTLDIINRLAHEYMNDMAHFSGGGTKRIAGSGNDYLSTLSLLSTS